MNAVAPIPTADPARALRWLLALALTGVCATVFANAAHSGLTYDDKYFTPGEFEWSLRSVAQLFSEDAWAASGAPSRLYRPLMWLLLWVEGTLHGPRPLWFHITCIALHIAATLLLFSVLIELLALPRPPADATTPTDREASPSLVPTKAQVVAAAVAALIFAVHPIHTEAINSIFNRTEILATLGVLAALRLLLGRLRTVGPGASGPVLPLWLWVVVGVIYLASLLCRESALSLPLLLAIVLFGLRPDLLQGALPRRQLLLALLCFLVPLGIYLVLRSHALAQRGGLLSAMPTAPAASSEFWPIRWLPLQRLGPALCMLREGLRMLFYPQPLRASYDTLPGGGAAAALIFHILVLGSALLCRRSARPLLVGLLFFYVALAPSTRPFSSDPIASQMAERFLYLPSVGLAISLAFLLACVLSRRPRHEQLGLLAACLAVAGLFATWTVRRNADWASSLALWGAELRGDPQSVTAVRLLTAAQIEQGQATAAAALCDTYLPRHGSDARLQNHCAIAYDNSQRPDAAETAYRRAVALGLGAMAHANLARWLDRTGRTAEARTQAELAVEAEGDPARRHYRRGLYLLRYHAGRRDEAAQEFQRALAIQPRFRAAQAALANLLPPAPG